MLAVGDSTELEIIFSTKEYTKRTSKSPRITTNEGPPDKRVTIDATVVERPDSTYPVVIEPYKLDLSQFSEKTVDERPFQIVNVSDHELHPKLIAGPSKMMDIKLPSSIGPGKSAEGKVKLLDKALADSFEKSFTFELDDQAHSRFTVPVKRTLRTPTQGISTVKDAKVSAH